MYLFIFSSLFQEVFWSVFIVHVNIAMTLKIGFICQRYIHVLCICIFLTYCCLLVTYFVPWAFVKAAQDTNFECFCSQQMQHEGAFSVCETDTKPHLLQHKCWHSKQIALQTWLRGDCVRHCRWEDCIFKHRVFMVNTGCIVRGWETESGLWADLLRYANT